jgi:hypothetical protein
MESAPTAMRPRALEKDSTGLLQESDRHRVQEETQTMIIIHTKLDRRPQPACVRYARRGADAATAHRQHVGEAQVAHAMRSAGGVNASGHFFNPNDRTRSSEPPASEIVKPKVAMPGARPFIQQRPKEEHP